MIKIFLQIILVLSVIAIGFVSYLYFFPPCIGLACAGSYSFQDTAYFTAPISNLEIEVISSGSVPEGHDLGYGNATVKMYRIDTTSDTMYLKTSPENIDSISYKGQTIAFSCSQMEKHLFYDYLVSVGFVQIDENEISELRDAMTFINYGHKIGFIKGQTKYILVGKQTLQ